MFIDRGKGAETENKAIFDQLAAHKADIEKAFGGPLVWERLDAKRACRIRADVPSGYRSPEEEWPAIHTTLVDAMTRFEATLRPHLKTLKVGQ